MPFLHLSNYSNQQRTYKTPFNAASGPQLANVKQRRISGSWRAVTWYGVLGVELKLPERGRVFTSHMFLGRVRSIEKF